MEQTRSSALLHSAFLHVPSYTVQTPSFGLAGGLCIPKQEHRREIGEEKAFQVVNWRCFQSLPFPFAELCVFLRLGTNLWISLKPRPQSVTLLEQLEVGENPYERISMCHSWVYTWLFQLNIAQLPPTAFFFSFWCLFTWLVSVISPIVRAFSFCN